MTAIIDVSFPGQRTITASSCIPQKDETGSHDEKHYMKMIVHIADHDAVENNH